MDQQASQAAFANPSVAIGATSGGGPLPVSDDERFASVKTPEEVDSEELKKKLVQAPAKPKIDDVVQAANNIFQRNSEYRRISGVEEEMLSSLRQRAGTYDNTKLAAIQAVGGSAVFLTLTTVKCRHAEAILRDVFGSGNNPWTFDPSPLPSLPEDARQAIVTMVMLAFAKQLQATGQPMDPQQAYQQASGLRDTVSEALQAEAKVRSDRMQQVVSDQFTEGHWTDAFDSFITNLVTLKAGIIKGPTLRERDELVWSKDLQGRTVPKVVKVLRHEWDAINPLDAYPHESSVDCQKGDFVERCRFHPSDLLARRTGPGYYSDQINQCVSTFGITGYSYTQPIDVERAVLEKRLGTYMHTHGMIEAIEVWTSLTGSALIERNVRTTPDGKAVKPGEYYEVNIIACGPYLLYLTVNPDPLRRRPYFKTVYEKIPGSFWGKGVPELMKDLQGIVNAAVRALVNNAGSASTYQTIINDATRLAPGEDPTLPMPARVWQFLNPGNNGLKPLDFFQPQSNAGDLLAIMREFVRMADDYTGIPAYSYGSDDVAGAGRTSSGLAMLMDNAARGIKNVLARIDQFVVAPSVSFLYQWNMIYNPDENIKGDMVVVPRGVLAQIMREQMSQRRFAFLNATNNPTDQQIMGLEGRATVLRAEAANCELPVNEVVRKKEVLQGIERMAQQAQAAAMVQEQQQRQPVGAGAPA